MPFASLSGAATPPSDSIVSVPQAKLITYATGSGQSSAYLEQAPQVIPKAAPILIYMHGAKRDENQGMELYPDLRKFLAQHQVIYVSARDYEFDHLVAHLEARHGKRKIFLSGASLGGYMTYQEVRKHPTKYAGLIQIGSALYQAPTPKKGDIVIPTYFIFGDRDPGHTDGHHRIIRALKKWNAPIKAYEKPNDGHEAPYRDQSWWPVALKFVMGLDVEPTK